MSASAPEQATHSPRVAIVCLVLGVATLLLYAPARHFDYVSLDDPFYTQPPQVKSGWTWLGVRWAFTTGHAANWHPITWLSHMTDAQLFGDNPAGPHLINAVLHAVNAMLVFAALNALTRQPWPSAMVAALFAFHPLRVESVAWVAERKDLLSGLFFLLTLIAYERFARRVGAAAYALALLAFALGLLSKPMLVTVPFVLLLLDCWPLKRPARLGLLVEKAPFFVLALASSAVTFFVQRHAGAIRGDQIYPLPLRIENAVLAYGRYLWKTVWPARLAVFYPYEGAIPGTSIWTGAVIATVIVLVAITVGALCVWRWERAVLVGWVWFLGMLVPVIGIVQVGLQSMADRYTYLPHVGLFTAVVFGASRFLMPRVATMVVLPALIGLAWQSSAQLSTWQNTNTLFTHALAVTDHNHVAHNNLGYTYMRQSRYDDAIRQFQEVIAIDPRKAEPYYNIAVCLDEMHRPDQAQQWYEQALKRGPDYVDAHINLGNALLAQKQLDAAIAHYRRAVELSPESFNAHYNLSIALKDAGDETAAAFHLAQAVKLARSQGLTDLLGELQRQNTPQPLPKPPATRENLQR